MNKSESIQNLAKALAEFQSEVENPKNIAFNPYFNSKYAPLEEVLNISRPLLSKHGLSISQSPSGDGQNVHIHTLLLHNSGEWIEFDPLTLRAEKVSPQSVGSAITYGRRYALSSILGLSSEDDDDGNYASEPRTHDSRKEENKNNPDDKFELSEAQIKRAYAIGYKKGKTADDVRRWCSKVYNKEIKALTKSEYEKLIEKLEELPDAEVKTGGVPASH